MTHYQQLEYSLAYTCSLITSFNVLYLYKSDVAGYYNIYHVKCLVTDYRSLNIVLIYNLSGKNKHFMIIYSYVYIHTIEGKDPVWNIRFQYFSGKCLLERVFWSVCF